MQEIPVGSTEETEDAARRLRELWNLGMGSIACVTDVLEGRGVHVIEIETNEKFDGLSAVVEDETGGVIGAAVATRQGVAGERQRLDLAHELGHLVMRVTPEMDEETASFLAPAETIHREIGWTRA